jgi:HD-GYP domain-containing protein (c-di-GMP phosphodiesterase class II)
MVSTPNHDWRENTDYLNREELRLALLTGMQALVNMLEIRDPYTAGHQRRAANLAGAIARQMELPRSSYNAILIAATLHDLGKIAVPSEILSKPGPLTEAEFNLLQTHPQVGCEILQPIKTPWPIATIVLQHHERLDGSGYPQKLVGTDILLEARILAVADYVEAMTSQRPYHTAHSLPETLASLQKDSAALFDQEVVQACLTVFKTDFDFSQEAELHF